MKNVLLIAAEAAPLAKTGGLADVVGTLPRYLRPLGFDCPILMPCHSSIRRAYGDSLRHLCHFYISLGWRRKYVGLERLELDGLTVYLLDNEDYFGGPVYRGGEAEIEQYAWFSRAVCEVLPQLPVRPQALHVNDWHTALIPLLLKSQYLQDWRGSLPSLLTIHNIAYQGLTGFPFLQDLLSLPDGFNSPAYVELHGAASFLAAGCRFCDRVNLVSPSNAREVCTPEYGYGLEGVLSQRGEAVSGILNGLDCRVYDPALDPALPVHFTAASPGGKRSCKQALVRELGLSLPPDAPLLGMVTRLTPQKGLDLVERILPWLMAQDLGLVILGTGDGDIEAWLRQAEWRYKGRLCSYLAYSDPVARRIYAGSDFFLMPSRFEPCGLSQMIAMRYGSLPIVRETGGLRDTVRPYNQFTGEGNGFSFAHYDGGELADAVKLALSVYHNRPVLDKLIGQAMAEDFSFTAPARSYGEIYAGLIN